MACCRAVGVGVGVGGQETNKARVLDLDLAHLGTGPDPWGGPRAAFRATVELPREDFAMNHNQVVQGEQLPPHSQRQPLHRCSPPLGHPCP
ncbi:hypothetical protein [Streptomyces canus]|uniref:hypothetical protein n=1 Tax=Streptomyces canus TaxID=58343 RepID=UPI003864A4C7|nr:hypothetical protein OH824_15605 [Streptomyces canus]